MVFIISNHGDDVKIDKLLFSGVAVINNNFYSTENREAPIIFSVTKKTAGGVNGTPAGYIIEFLLACFEVYNRVDKNKNSLD